MKNLINTTVESYIKNFSSYIDSVPKEPNTELKIWFNRFIQYLPQKAKVFEFGSAAGRDALYLRNNNIQMTCTDVVPQAIEILTELGFESYLYNFSDPIKDEWVNKFDGVLANAVLLHAPEQIFLKTLSNISEILKSGGILAVSLQLGSGEDIMNNRKNMPRFFKFYSEESFLKTLKNLPFKLIELYNTEDQKWLHAILKKD